MLHDSWVVKHFWKVVEWWISERVVRMGGGKMIGKMFAYCTTRTLFLYWYLVVLILSQIEHKTTTTIYVPGVLEKPLWIHSMHFFESQSNHCVPSGFVWTPICTNKNKSSAIERCCWWWWCWWCCYWIHSKFSQTIWA